MEREERRLDDERREEAEEDPGAVARPRIDQVERALAQPEDDDRGQHQQRAGHRVDHERQRRLRSPRTAPHADQHVERDQHRLEEGVEEDEVLRHEHAGDRADEEEHQPEVRARPVSSGPPRVGDRSGARDDREADEPEREAVEADVVRDAEVAEPRVPLLALDSALEVEVEERDDPEADLDERDQGRDRAGPEPRPRDQPEQERAGDRQEDERRRQPAAHRSATKRTARTASPAVSASA